MFSDNFIKSDVYKENIDFLFEYQAQYINSMATILRVSPSDLDIKLIENIESLINNKTKEQLSNIEILFNKIIKSGSQMKYEESCFWIKSLFVMDDDQIIRLGTSIDIQKAKMDEIDEMYRNTSFDIKNNNSKNSNSDGKLNKKDHINWLK